MRKVIVTGASGFIGSYLIKELIKNNVEVIAVVRNKNIDIRSIPRNLRLVYCELYSIKDLIKLVPDNNIDVFYHLAWSGTGGKERSDYQMQLQNCKYTCDSAVVARRMNCKKFVVTGTITEMIADDILDQEINSDNLIYGIAKHLTHSMLHVLCKNLDLKYVWTRLSNIYGIGNSTGNIVSYCLNELQKNNVPLFSKAEQPYDLMYVKDTVKALRLIGFERTVENCYFVGSGESRILKEYLITIKNLYGQGSDIKLGAKPADGLVYKKEWFDTTLLKKDTGFDVSYSFEEGMQETIQDIREY